MGACMLVTANCKLNPGNQIQAQPRCLSASYFATKFIFKIYSAAWIWYLKKSHIWTWRLPNMEMTGKLEIWEIRSSSQAQRSNPLKHGGTWASLNFSGIFHVTWVCHYYSQRDFALVRPGLEFSSSNFPVLRRPPSPIVLVVVGYGCMGPYQ